MKSTVPSRDKDLDVFSERHTTQLNKKLLSEALVYLKLREIDCDRKQAICFAKRRQKQIDGTVQKDGPPGFKNLVPIKDPNRQLLKGWAKQKLQYKGTIGYARQIELAVSQEKKAITQHNAIQRNTENERRKYQKGFGLKKWVNTDQINRFNDGLKNILKDVRSKSQQSLKSKRNSVDNDKISTQQLKRNMETPTYVQQINLLKEDIMKQRQLKPMYVTFHGQKMQQITKYYVKDLQESDPNGFIARLGVFEDDVLNDVQLVQGEGKQGQFQQKRQRIQEFRRSLREWNPSSNDRNKVQDQRNLQNISNLPMSSQKESKQDIQKVDLRLLKNRSSVPFSSSSSKWMRNFSMVPNSNMKIVQKLKDSKVNLTKFSDLNSESHPNSVRDLKTLKTKSVSKIQTGPISVKSNKNWKKKDQQFEQDFQKIVALIQLSKIPCKKQLDKLKEPGSPGSPISPRSPLLRNNSNVSGVSSYINNGQEEQEPVDLTQLMKNKIWNI